MLRFFIILISLLTGGILHSQIEIHRVTNHFVEIDVNTTRNGNDSSVVIINPCSYFLLDKKNRLSAVLYEKSFDDSYLLKPNLDLNQMKANVGTSNFILLPPIDNYKLRIYFPKKFRPNKSKLRLQLWGSINQKIVPVYVEN